MTATGAWSGGSRGHKSRGSTRPGRNHQRVAEGTVGKQQRGGSRGDVPEVAVRRQQGASVRHGADLLLLPAANQRYTIRSPTILPFSGPNQHSGSFPQWYFPTVVLFRARLNMLMAAINAGDRQRTRDCGYHTPTLAVAPMPPAAAGRRCGACCRT